MMTGCSSSTKVSPVLIDECKAVAIEKVKGPDSDLMDKVSTPVPYTKNQIAKGVSRSEVVNNQTQNNALWEQDRRKVLGLQAYIKTLQEKGIIAE
ncbi:hypothetical protein JR326_gp265 [Escherichia phage ukendt]|uniref:Uncharacterized protein n=1 Tax=Escherichia phage ukendt TaxID=2696458 RepID=A0A6B9WM65_9CAUD|nr:hypothetical protein JR326_gp265 [Escherichia phage ukendt]QHR65010.1 hypothetical protein ukendt_214 [Escherichia phage ukendt]